MSRKQREGHATLRVATTVARVQATFFNIGLHVKEAMALRLLKEGHTLGGHTYKHDDMTNLDMAQAWDDTLAAEQCIRNATGRFAPHNHLVQRYLQLAMQVQPQEATRPTQ